MNTLMLILSVVALLALAFAGVNYKHLPKTLQRVRNAAGAFAYGCILHISPAALANDGAVTVGTHQYGRCTGFHDNAPQTTRWLLAKQGSADNYYAIPTTTLDMPVAVCADEPAAVADPVTFIRLNAAAGTVRMVAAGAIAAGAIVVTNGDGKVKTLPSTSGVYWQVGVAVTTAVSNGDLLEVDPCLQQVGVNYIT